MPELITITTSRQPQPTGLIARAKHALRAYWSGPYSLKDPALNELFGSGARTIAGPVINEMTAFMCSAVWDAVQQISSDVAKLPLNLRKRRQDGGSDVFTASKLYRLLKARPNQETGSMLFRRTLLTHALITGNGYAEIDRDQEGRPAALWNIEPHRVRPYRDTDRVLNGRRGPLRYLVDGRTEFDARDIIHIQGIGWDGVMGFDLVQVARQAIGLALASEQFAASFFGNGTRFGGILSTERELTEEQEQELRATIEKFHASAEKAWRLLILEQGFKFEQGGVAPNEAQMKEIRDQQVSEIARFYNMPLHKLKLNTPGAVSYASVEMADLDYFKGCLLNWITLVEEEFNAKLIPSLEQSSQYFKHNANAFLRGTIKDRYDALAVAHDRGIINADEWRELEDLNPQPNGQGQVYLVQGAMIPKDQLVELTDAKIKSELQKAKPQPAPQPAPAAEPNPRLAELEAEARAAQERAETALREADEERAKCERLGEAHAGVSTQYIALSKQYDALEGQLAEARDVIALAKVEAAALDARLSGLEAVERANAEFGLVNVQLQEEISAVKAEREAVNEAVRRAESERDEAKGREVEVRAEMLRAMADQAKSEHALGEALAIEADTRRAAEARTEEAIAAANDLEAARLAAEERAAASLAEAAAFQEQASKDAWRATEAQERLDHAQEAMKRAIEAQQAAEAVAATSSAELETLRAEVEGARAELARVTADQAAREAATIAAHRGQILDALGRITRREVQKAREKQATPEKLRRWLKGYPALEEPIAVDFLLPAMRMHLALMRSDEDPAAVTATIIRGHMALFTERLNHVLESDPDDFTALLEKTLTRWETERPASVADALLMEEIRHVRAQ